jgi:L,D-peptidoglycan transpeptidase YkuD (ErfK/YbiS/YcfS/YnhG family)
MGRIYPVAGKGSSGMVAAMNADDLVVTPTGLRFRNRWFACTVGRGGVTGAKREGDGASPRGVHGIVGLLYRPDRMAKPVNWAVPIRLGDLWSDDPDDEDYNLLVKAPYPHSHEVLRRADPMYDLIVITNWNWPHAKRGRGSGIFIHQWRRPGYPTAGCIGLDRGDLRWIAQRLKIGAKLRIL